MFLSSNIRGDDPPVREDGLVMTLRRLALLALLCPVTACSSSHHATSASRASVTCETTPLRRGAAPKWTAAAWATSSGGFASHLRYVISARGNVVGVLFSHQLRSGRPENPANKILWIVRQPRNGQPLHIHAAPIGFTSRGVTTSWPANSSPGEIYPSIDDVPLPGCWRFSLRWAGHSDVVALHYSS
jgi:hypothetical protein